MGVKSVVEIDVEDEEFKRFSEEFDKYREKLQKLPGAWAGVDKATKTSFETVAAALIAHNKIAADTKKKSKEFDEQSRRTSGSWRDLVASTREVARNVKDITLNALKWASLGGIASGLLGGGSLFGLDALGAAAGGFRRQALGLGVGIGEERGFELNFERLVDSRPFLTAVSAALHDVTKRGALYAAGLVPDQIEGHSAAEVSISLLQSLKRLADATPQSLLGSVLQARGLDQFMSLQDFERLKNTPRTELDQYIRSYARDRRQLDLIDGTAKEWQELDLQLSRAGKRIESVFIRGLEPLIRSGAIDRLSQAIADSVDTLMSSPQLKVWLSDLGKGIKHLADYVASPAFQADLRTFASDVAAVAKGLKNALEWLGLIPSRDDDRRHETEKKMGVREEHPFPGIRVYTGKNSDRFLRGESGKDTDRVRQDFGSWLGRHINGTVVGPKGFQDIEDRFSIPRGLLWGVYGAESSFGTNPGPSSAGAEGPFQFMPGTWRKYGSGSPYDTGGAAVAAGHYLSDLLLEYNGDVKKALASYNWRDRLLQEDVASHGARWFEYVPRETRDYVNKVMGILHEEARTGQINSINDRVDVAGGRPDLPATVKRIVGKHHEERRRDDEDRRTVKQIVDAIRGKANQQPVRASVEIINSTGGAVSVSSNQIAQ